MSSFSWLDYAEADRERALDVIDLFREQDTRDELGIATIRDTFSNLFFPGTGAIQTRARYFFIVPWTYQRLERSRVASHEVAQRDRREEIALIDVLDASPDNKGTIGVRARKSLKRLPSSVYWQGLRQLGIGLFPGSRDQYHRSLDAFYQRAAQPARNDDGELVTAGRIRNWHPALPPAPPGFPASCSLSLTRREAEFLRERIMQAAPASLLAHLVDVAAPAPEVDFVWEHPDADRFPTRAAVQLQHARNFSELIHGASLLYNFMLAELSESSELTDSYSEDLMEWTDRVVGRWSTYQRWNQREFWDTVFGAGGRIPLPTRTFVSEWLAIVLERSGADLRSSDRARSLIHERERQLKRGLARLDGGRVLELWGGAAGADQLDYRWNAIAAQLVQDVHDGLERADA